MQFCELYYEMFWYEQVKFRNISFMRFMKTVYDGKVWWFVTRTKFLSIIAAKSPISIYYVVQHENIAIFKSVLRRFGSAFFKPH